jgi:hypothetical protein
MRTVFKVLLVGAVMAIVFVGLPHAQFYYGATGTVQLRIDSSRVLIKFNSDLDEDGISAVLADLPMIGEQLDDKLVLDGFRAYRIQEPAEPGAPLPQLHATTGISLAEPYYLDSDDSAFVVGETFIAAFDSSLSLTQIESLAG